MPNLTPSSPKIPFRRLTSGRGHHTHPPDPGLEGTSKRLAVYVTKLTFEPEITLYCVHMLAITMKELYDTITSFNKDLWDRNTRIKQFVTYTVRSPQTLLGKDHMGGRVHWA